MDDWGVAQPELADLKMAKDLLGGDLTSLDLYFDQIQSIDDIPVLLLEQLGGRLTQLLTLVDMTLQQRASARPQEEAEDDNGDPKSLGRSAALHSLMRRSS